LSAEDAGCSPSDLVEQLLHRRQSITPTDLRGGAPEHLRSVLVVSRLISKMEKSPQRGHSGEQCKAELDTELS